MVRLILRLFGIKDFEVCASCETWKYQMEIVNEEKRMLTETLLRLVKPEVVHTSQPIFVNPKAVHTTFTKRRAELERSHAAAKRTRDESPFLAKTAKEIQTIPDREPNLSPVKQESVDEMEARLGLHEISEGPAKPN